MKKLLLKIFFLLTVFFVTTWLFNDIVIPILSPRIFGSPHDLSDIVVFGKRPLLRFSRFFCQLKGRNYVELDFYKLDGGSGFNCVPSILMGGEKPTIFTHIAGRLRAFVWLFTYPDSEGMKFMEKVPANFTECSEMKRNLHYTYKNLKELSWKCEQTFNEEQQKNLYDTCLQMRRINRDSCTNCIKRCPVVYYNSSFSVPQTYEECASISDNIGTVSSGAHIKNYCSIIISTENAVDTLHANQLTQQCLNQGGKLLLQNAEGTRCKLEFIK